MTWLNSLPYTNSVFLSELQQSAADFQTHTLATANAVYDTDAVSYERLLALTRVCEQFAVHAAGVGVQRRWNENLDSDDERFDAVVPLPRQRADVAQDRPGAGPLELDHQSSPRGLPRPGERANGPGDDLEGRCEGGEGGCEDQDQDQDEQDRHDENKEHGSEAFPQHYPVSIVMRNTQIKAGSWVQWVMVQWEGYSVAEATWETDWEFYQTHYPDLLKAFNDSRVPQRVVGTKIWYEPGTGEPHYRVRWEGTSWTTMERVTDVQRDPAYARFLVDFRKRQQRALVQGERPCTLAPCGTQVGEQLPG